MRFVGKYGNLPGLQAAKESLREIEAHLTQEEWAYIKNDEWRVPNNDRDYELHRLIDTIMGLQQIVIKNGETLAFSRLPRIWQAHEQS